MQHFKTSSAKWESGESVPNIEKLILLADLFEISIDELVGRIQTDSYNQFVKYLNTHFSHNYR